MFNPDLSELLKDKTSRYSLVSAVAKRARELSEDKVMSEIVGTEKTVSYALEEFLDGELLIVEPEEIRNI